MEIDEKRLLSAIGQMMDEKLDLRFNEQDAKLDLKFDAIDRKFYAIDKKFDAIDARFIEQDARIDARFIEQDARIDAKFKQQHEDIMKSAVVLMDSDFGPRFTLLAEEVTLLREQLTPLLSTEPLEQVWDELGVHRATLKRHGQDIAALQAVR